MKIWIRGAGDLATGIASRLYRSGHQLLMTELPLPLTVRRTVALSRAVYEQHAEVEDMSALLVHSIKEALEVQVIGKIPVIIEEPEVILKEYQPDVVVDAILAKRNLGTEISWAPFVVGVGPGFTAGVDCHCVVETKRGHTLGDVIWEGEPIPNTGVPGNVGGFTLERLIKATADGVIEPKVQIGDIVEKGQLVAITGGEPVYAKMSGIVRGMLQPGVTVQKNLKVGDIDARCERKNCYLISDKARAIGGGVLEAVTQFERIYGQYAVVVLAAGSGSRFGGNKLQELKSDKPMYQYMLDKMEGLKGFPTYIVTGADDIAEAARKYGMKIVENKKPEEGISRSVKLGLETCLAEHPGIKGILFSVCDQPELTFSTMFTLIRKAMLRPQQIICTGKDKEMGNPVLWDKKYFPELMELTGDVGGKKVMQNHLQDIIIVEIDEAELKDIDYRRDLE